MDRVTELGDASVPFRFDVHALFFSNDAVALEISLLQHFADRRLNRVNLRRKYFRATPAEVVDALSEKHVEVLEYVLEPAAEEYRESVVLAGSSPLVLTPPRSGKGASVSAPTSAERRPFGRIP